MGESVSPGSQSVPSQCRAEPRAPRDPSVGGAGSGSFAAGAQWRAAASSAAPAGTSALGGSLHREIQEKP